MKKLTAMLLVLMMLFSFAACGAQQEQQTTPAETAAETAAAPRSVETDLADMTWDEILAEAKGQSLTLNVYNADTQVAKFWDRVTELAKDYDIDVTIVSETADTDARMIADYQNGDTASYDMTWGYYG